MELKEEKINIYNLKGNLIYKKIYLKGNIKYIDLRKIN